MEGSRFKVEPADLGVRFGLVLLVCIFDKLQVLAILVASCSPWLKGILRSPVTYATGPTFVTGTTFATGPTFTTGPNIATAPNIKEYSEYSKYSQSSDIS